MERGAAVLCPLGTEPRRERESVFARSLNSLMMLGNDMACCCLFSFVLNPKTSNIYQSDTRRCSSKELKKKKKQSKSNIKEHKLTIK